MAAKKIPAKRTVNQIKTAVAEKVDSPIEAGERAAALKTAGDINYDKIVASMSTLSADVGRTFSTVQQQFIAKVNELTELDKAIDAKTEQLQTLLDVGEVQLDLRRVVEEAERAKEEAREGAAAYEKEIAQSQQDAARAREIAESEYTYSINQRKQADKDDFARQSLLRKEQLDQMTKDREADWKAREAVLAAKEAEYTKALAEAAAFPEKLKQEVDKEVAKATNSLKRDLTHSFAMEKKDLETQLSLEQAKTKSMENTMDRMLADNEALRRSNDEAQKRVVEIAKGGFDSVSKQLALDSVLNMNTNKENGSAKGRS